MLIEPRDGVQLYCGDALEVLPTLSAGSVDAVVTDPVWEQADSSFLPGGGDSANLLAAMISVLPVETRRLVIQLGCYCDPRILATVPPTWPFIRVAWLRYTIPGFRDRVLVTSDVAYIFGTPPTRIPGNISLSGECLAPGRKALPNGHPCPRRIEHLTWLVEKFTDKQETILDPFMGSGTTGVACVMAGRRFIGVELEPKYFDIAVRRISEAQAPLPGVE